MNFNEEIKVPLQTALLFIVFTSVFTLFGNISTLIIMGVDKNSVVYFLKSNTLWFIIVILVIIGLIIYLKKVDGKYNPLFIPSRPIWSTIGLLLAFEGLVIISSRGLAFLLYIQTSHQVTIYFKEPYMRSILASFIVPIIINLIRILLGLYFILKRNNSKLSK